MTKRSIALLVLILVAIPLGAERRNQQITVSAGTPVRISGVHLLVDRLFIQSKAGNTGIVYVMLGVPRATTCDATSPAQLTAQLGPGDATHPGGAFSDPQGANGFTPPDGEDMYLACIDGSHTGDVAIISYWKR